jgi:nucleotide-binding universal stress UspA family protein
MKILLAADGSAFTIKAAKYLVDHLQWFKQTPELHLLNVRLPIPAGLAVTNAQAIRGDDVTGNYYKEEAATALEPAEKILREHGIPFEASFSVGDIAHEIQRYASAHQIDMIVMGSHGHGALASVMLGSIASKVLATAHIPVLIVR